MIKLRLVLFLRLAAIYLLSTPLAVGQESIEIYFTQPVYSQFYGSDAANVVTGGDMVKARTIEMIKFAHYTLDVCMYNASDFDIIAALIQATDRGVRVRYITDDNTSNSALDRNLPFPVLYSSIGDGIMHNKFMVADAFISNKSMVMAGSMNWTSSGEFQDANNIFFIRHSDLALTFTKEFEEMWGNSGDYPTSAAVSGNQKRNNTRHQFNIAGIPIELYFAPSDGNETKIDSVLKLAQFSVDFGMYTFTSTALSSELVDLNNQGVQIRGIVDNFETSDQVYYRLKQQGIDVQNHYPDALLHHKYCVIDAGHENSDPTVVTGSFNWTYSANTINDEYSFIIHDAAIANLFTAEFDSRYCDLVPAACNATSTNRQNSELPAIESYLTSGYVKINTESIIPSGVSLSIYTSLGQPVLFKKASPENQTLISIDLSTLPNGIYWGELVGDNYRKVIRILKSE